MLGKIIKCYFQTSSIPKVGNKWTNRIELVRFGFGFHSQAVWLGFSKIGKKTSRSWLPEQWEPWNQTTILQGFANEEYRRSTTVLLTGKGIESWVRLEHGPDINLERIPWQHYVVTLISSRDKCLCQCYICNQSISETPGVLMTHHTNCYLNLESTTEKRLGGFKGISEALAF